MVKAKEFWSRTVRAGAILSPVDRISEVLFGLIMTLTFTGTISVYMQDRNEISSLLWAALGCNLAWGLVDAIMYIMNVMLERGHAIKTIKALRSAHDAKEAGAVIKEEIQPTVAHLLTEEEITRLYNRLLSLPEPEIHHVFQVRDLWLMLQIFLLVFLCTLPVALPFVFMQDVTLAMRTSNGIALLFLFIGGFKLAKYAGFRPFITALGYSLIGIALVTLTMALGG